MLEGTQKQGRTHHVLRGQRRGAWRERAGAPRGGWETRGFHDTGKKFTRKQRGTSVPASDTQRPWRLSLLITRERLYKCKSMAFQRAIRELKSWGKLAPRTLKKQANTENHSCNQFTWSRDPWSQHWEGHVAKNFRKFLEVECELAWIFKTRRPQS